MAKATYRPGKEEKIKAPPQFRTQDLLTDMLTPYQLCHRHYTERNVSLSAESEKKRLTNGDLPFFRH